MNGSGRCSFLHLTSVGVFFIETVAPTNSLRVILIVVLVGVSGVTVLGGPQVVPRYTPLPEGLDQKAYKHTMTNTHN